MAVSKNAGAPLVVTINTVVYSGPAGRFYFRSAVLNPDGSSDYAPVGQNLAPFDVPESATPVVVNFGGWPIMTTFNPAMFIASPGYKSVLIAVVRSGSVGDFINPVASWRFDNVYKVEELLPQFGALGTQFQ